MVFLYIYLNIYYFIGLIGTQENKTTSFSTLSFFFPLRYIIKLFVLGRRATVISVNKIEEAALAFNGDSLNPRRYQTVTQHFTLSLYIYICLFRTVSLVL